MRSLTGIRVGVLAVALLLVGVQACTDREAVAPERATVKVFSVGDTICDVVIACDTASSGLMAKFLGARYSISNPAPHCDSLLDGFDDAVNGSMIRVYDHDDLTALGFPADIFAFWDPDAGVIAFADDAVYLLFSQFVALAFEEVDHFANGHYHPGQSGKLGWVSSHGQAHFDGFSGSVYDPELNAYSDPCIDE